MLCPECNLPMIVQVHQQYHYQELNLDNLYLENVTIGICTRCRSISLQDFDQLFLENTIAEAITLKPCSLKGLELAFLRERLSLSAEQWAKALQVEFSALCLWETSRQTPPMRIDMLWRLLYLQVEAVQSNRVAMLSIIQGLANIDYHSNKPMAIMLDMANNGQYYYLS